MKRSAIIDCLPVAIAPLRAVDPGAGVLRQLPGSGQRPDGVVFELSDWEDGSWDWAAPLLADYIGRLRAKFPEPDVALISHGAESFDLSRRANLQAEPSIQALAALGADIRICGEYASSKRLGPSDFVDFVDVAAGGSAQLADYIDLGFVHIRLEPASAAD